MELFSGGTGSASALGPRTGEGSTWRQANKRASSVCRVLLSQDVNKESTWHSCQTAESPLLLMTSAFILFIYHVYILFTITRICYDTRIIQMIQYTQLFTVEPGFNYYFDRMSLFGLMRNTWKELQYQIVIIIVNTHKYTHCICINICV